MDIHYAKIIIGNITLTYGVIRGLLGYSLGVILALLYIELEKINILYKNTFTTKIVFTFLEITMLVCYLILYGSTNYIRQNELLFPLWCMIFVLCAMLEKGLVSRILKIKLFYIVGKKSYYIYLVHMIVLVILNHLTNYEIHLFLYLFLTVILALLLESSHKIVLTLIRKLHVKND